MIEENFLFRKVGEIPQSHVVTCQPWQEVHTVALSIREARATGAVVCDDKIPIGIITDSDFRDLFALRRSCEGVKAEEIMRSPIIKLTAGDFVHEAIYLMTRNFVRHLVVVDEMGEFEGVISDADLMNVHTASPVYYKQEIEACQSLREVRDANGRVARVIDFATGAGARTRDVVRLISMFNDAISRRAIFLVERDKGVALPEGSAFVALGSEGRREQTLRTDQDNAIILADGTDHTGHLRAEEYGFALTEALNFIGVPFCKGGTMASNPEWRKTESEWGDEFDSWVRATTPESLVRFGTFQDFRFIHGDRAVVGRLKERMAKTVRSNSIFLSRVARNVTRFAPPLSFFDTVKGEKNGDRKGLVNLKKAGIFALAEGISLIALESGAAGETTWEKLETLASSGVLSAELAGELELAFTFLMWLRIHTQLKCVARGEAPGDYANPGMLSVDDEARLVRSLKTVRKFLKVLKDRYQTDYLRG